MTASDTFDIIRSLKYLFLNGLTNRERYDLFPKEKEKLSFSENKCQF